MAYVCSYDGVIFSEGSLPGAAKVAPVEIDLGKKLGAQLKTLNDIKAALASQAKALGANAIENFTYGQKHRWLAFDDVSFWGKGYAVTLAQDEYEQLMQKR